MNPEKFMEQLDIRQFRPFAGMNREAIHIVDSRIRNGEDERGVGGDNKLALICPSHS